MRWLDGITDSKDMSLSELQQGVGQGGLVGCSPWGRRKSDMTERLNINNNWLIVSQTNPNPLNRMGSCQSSWKTG